MWQLPVHHRPTLHGILHCLWYFFSILLSCDKVENIHIPRAECAHPVTAALSPHIGADPSIPFSIIAGCRVMYIREESAACSLQPTLALCR